MHDDIKKIMLTHEQLEERIKELGKEISDTYRGHDLLIVCILKGAILFFSDLARHIDIPVSMDFMAVSSYGGGTKSSGVVRILKDLDRPAQGMDILIIEDIVDSGNTLSYLKRTLMSRKPASLRICSLLDKPERRESDIEVDFTGFEIPDEFVVGYGLDYAEKYRNLPYVGVLKDSVYTNVE